MNANDTGIPIRIDVLEDVSDGSVFQIKMLSSTTGVVQTFTAALMAGSNQVLEYVTLDGDVPTAGEYKLQAYVEQPTQTRHSAVATIAVGRVLA